VAEPDQPSLEEFERQRRALAAAVERGPGYDIEAYAFVCDGVHYTCHQLGERRHISGPELLNGLCDMVVERFGDLADLVLAHWGITRTDDIGEIVFHLVEVTLLSRRDEDSLQDFHNVFPLREALRERYRIELGPPAEH